MAHSEPELNTRWSRLRTSLARPPARIALLPVIAASLALLGSPQIYAPVASYAVGEFTARAIRAPDDFSLVDEVATDTQREQAAARMPVVARFDPSISASVGARLAEALAPVTTASAALAAATPSSPAPPPPTRAAQRALDAERQRAREAATSALDTAWDDAAATLGVEAPAALREAFRMSGGTPSPVEAARRLVEEAYTMPVVADLGTLDDLLTNAPDAPARTRQVALVEPSSARERVVAADAVTDLAEVRRRLVTRASSLLPDLDPAVRDWLTRAVTAMLRPDATVDAAFTEQRRRAAADAVLPVSLTFARNQLIIGEGERVTRQTVLVLDHLRRQRFTTRVISRVAGSAGLMFALLLLAFWTEDRGRVRFAAGQEHFTYVLVALVTTTLAFRGWLWLAEDLHLRFPSIPLLAFVLAFPAGAATMYTRVVTRFQTTIGFAFILAIFLGLMWRVDLLLAIYVLIIGLVGSHLVLRCNRRQCVVRAALVTGVIVAPVAACLGLLDGQPASGVAWVVAGGAAGAVLSGLVMLSASPVLEGLFGHLTRIRLVELMNYQHPLLRRLTEATPGTFQHSVTVGILCDVAARAIDADALLARVAALYHDVGKVAQPEYFIENEHDRSPHDGLSPAESARIIINHVIEGVRLVREAGVGERIADFVREHHGTSLARYFFIRAHEQDPSVGPEAFAYPGPRPRSRETAILMVADQVEATARSMPEPTEDAFRTMVQRTIDRAREEGQFDECPLTFQDLASIREALVHALTGVHHRRIRYPEPTAVP